VSAGGSTSPSPCYLEINGYGTARQLTLYEAAEAVLQVLTSDTRLTGASLLCWLRARWRIENVFQYASTHHGIDSLGDCRTDIVTDDRMVTNPARVPAKKVLAEAEVALAVAERALLQALPGPSSASDKNAELPKLHRRIEEAAAEVRRAKAALRPIRAKVATTDINPDARRAIQRLERRGLQMVLRLLAFNAEAWCAERFNAYLADDNDYRAILRHLLHLAATITYGTVTVTVTLDRPDSPRVARCLQLLTEELSALETHIPGNQRPLAYRVAG